MTSSRELGASLALAMLGALTFGCSSASAVLSGLSSANAPPRMSQAPFLALRGQDVVACDPRSGQRSLVVSASLKMEPRVAVMSSSGRFLCVHYRCCFASGPDRDMIAIIEAVGVDWRPKWTTEIADLRGTPIFAGDDEYLIMGRVSHEHLGWRGGPCGGSGDSSRADALVLRVSDGTRVEAGLHPLYAAGPFEVLGSAFGKDRVLLTQWVAKAQARIVEYDVRSWRGRILRQGFAPLCIDADRFLFEDGGSVYLARFDNPEDSLQIAAEGDLVSVAPETGEALVQLWERDPAHAGKPLPKRYWINVDTKERRKFVE
jgi:hypothetical protein